VTHKIAVVLPVGAYFNNMRLTINLSHTYMKDIGINLKSPSGKILNLFNRHGKNEDNMVNTVISSQGTNALSDGNAPFTGTFRATGSLNVGPTQYISNVTSFADLYSDPAGNWTLALVDYADTDVGTLTSWEIVFYTASQSPSVSPSYSSSPSLSQSPSSLATYYPTLAPTEYPTLATEYPTLATYYPTLAPTEYPTLATEYPTLAPVTPDQCSGILVVIKVLTDNYPDETTWTLSNQCGKVRGMSGGPYSRKKSFHYVSECLPADEYKFTIKDSEKDGICCGNGSGSWEILVNGLSTHTGGKFRRSETKTFGVCKSPTVSPSQSPSLSPSLSPSPTVSQAPSMSPSLSQSPSTSQSPSQSPSQYCFQDLAGDEFRFRVGELFDAVDNYIHQGCATNTSCEVRQQYGDIGFWCTSKITNMYGLFYEAFSFNEPLDGWDLRSVTTTSTMFLDASSFNQPLNGWNVDKVTDMSFMFYGASQFNQPLNGWNTGNVVAMNNMFDGALQFNQPVNGWNVNSVQDMGWLFAYSDFINYNTRFHDFNQPLEGWDVSSVTNMHFMFAGAKFFNQPLNAWNVSGVTDMTGMFSRAPNFDQPLDQWKVDCLTDMNYMFQGATKFNKDLNAWNVSKVTSMIAIFNEAANFDQPLNIWNVRRVTSMESMFGKANNFNKPLNGWDVGNVINIKWMFYDASSFNQSLNGWNVSKVTIMSNSSDGWPYGMFEQASSYNKPLNAWDVRKVTNFNSMFYSAASFNQDLCSWGNIPTRPPKPIVWYPGSSKNPVYSRNSDMFSNSGCTYNYSPIKASRGPFCASKCIVLSESPTVSQSRSSPSQRPSLSPSSIHTPTSSHSSSYNDDYNWDDDNLYNKSNKSPNEPIANESHQVSVQAALARASTSSTTSTATSSSSSKTTTKKPILQTCIYAGYKNCPTKPGTKTAVSCSCRK
jgi:surface protein